MRKISLVIEGNQSIKSNQILDYHATPRIIDYGLLNLANFEPLSTNHMLVAFFIMPLYELNLRDYLSKFEGMQKVGKIIEIVSKLVRILKYVHASKRTFNDLKLENIMINTYGKVDADPEVYLIDFGFSKKYVKKDGKEHIEESEVLPHMQGNQLFASAL